MRLRSPAASRTRQGARNWTVVLAAVLCMVFATNASAALSGTFNAAGGTTGAVQLLGPAAGPYTVGVSGPGFCVGPPTSCNTGAGVTGTTALSGTQVTFTFFGSTVGGAGTFTIDLTGFTTPITGVTFNAGASDPFNDSPSSTFAFTSFTASSMLFTGSTTGAFNAIGGSSYVFDVTTAAAPIPEPSSIILLTTLIGGTMFIGRRRLLGNRGKGV